MKISNLPFGTIDWSKVERTRHEGETGHAEWRTQTFGDVRLRFVEYSSGYVADHWCQKGHFLFCLEGELKTELADGRVFVLKPGMSYQVADGTDPHKSSTESGAKLLIID